MLKYLNDRVDERVAAVAESCAVLATVLPSVRGETPRNLMGFDMPADLVNADVVARARANTLAAINFYRDDAAKLDKKLRGLGIEPMAIITAKAFDRIVAELGMFTLRPSETGKVSIDRTAILALKGKDGLHGWMMALASLGMLAAYVAGFYQWGWNVNTGDAGAVLGAIALGVVLGFAALGVAGALTDRFVARRFARRAQAWVTGQSWEQLLVALSYRDHGIPTRCFYGPDQNYDGYEAFQREVVLPPAPREVIDIICRIAADAQKAERGHALQLHIAAEAGAISFKGGLTGLFDLHAINALLAAEEAAQCDPILYVRGSCCVAIIAQYGDMPIEREMIDWIVNSEHLL